MLSDMPYSSDIFDSRVKSILRQIKPNRCLDIGAGAGKYGRLLREIMPAAISVGVEIESDYIQAYGLNEIYDEVRQMNAIDLITSGVDETFDLAIFGDVLEHMRKSDGMDLLNFLIYRTKWILAIFPTQYIQNSVAGYKSEAHISVWRVADFQVTKHRVFYNSRGQTLILLQGYLCRHPSKQPLKTHSRSLTARRNGQSGGRPM
jgi:hypothetical protein